MAEIKAKDVAHLGKLARIDLKQSDLKKMVPELEAILGYVEQLQKIDLKGVEPTNQVTGLVDVWRPDKILKKRWSRQELLRNAPKTKDGFIKVNKVL